MVDEFDLLLASLRAPEPAALTAGHILACAPESRCALQQPHTPKFKEWLAAEKAAHDAECELHAAMLRFARTSSEPPSPQVVLAVQAKRAKAHALFADAMQELKEVAESLHHRRILTRPTGTINTDHNSADRA